jgi:hypothetical protein
MADPRTASILTGIGRELKSNPPAILAKTRRKKGKNAAESQRRAILLAKGKSKGADI